VPAEWRGLLRDGARNLGIDLTGAELDGFECYMSLLLDWNRRVNLTAITDPAEIAILHFFDSLTCLAAASFGPNARVIDVGSGAGLPGIPIAVVRPDLRLTLLESTRKKCRFLSDVASSLDLIGVSVDCRRAEDAGRDPLLRGTFDVAVSRAVADLAVLAELCLPFVKVGGLMLAMKGPRVEEEMEQARRACAILGGEIEFTRSFALPAPVEPADRVVVGIRKISPTPDRYPRRAGMPAKRPLGIDTSKRCV
jgi:16S rRNA (guanine527-N7)-methyltransferase